MKKIIRGLRYDTEAPRTVKIGEAGEGNAISGDFHAWEAALYRTGGGRYFLAGEGGALTIWRNTSLIPMTKAEALEWAERNLDPDEVEAAFGDMIKEA